MTPREAAREIILGLPIESKGLALNAQLDFIERFIGEAITADRSQLQSEIVRAIGDCRNAVKFRIKPDEEEGYVRAVSDILGAVNRIFSQSRPAESKSETIYKDEENDVLNCGCSYHQGEIILSCRKHFDAESNRLILAEREACKGIVKNLYQRSIDENQRCEYMLKVIDEIRSRSNPEQGSEPDVLHLPPDTFSIFGDKGEPVSTVRLIDNSDRIRQLHETIGEQQVRIAQLEKERNTNELAQKLKELEPARKMVISLHHLVTDNCICVICEDSRSNNRKA